MASSPRFKSLSAQNEANTLVRVLTSGERYYDARRAILRHLPFASQYALACAVPGVTSCSALEREHDLLTMRKRERDEALTSWLLLYNQPNASRAFAEFLVNPIDAAWNEQHWRWCMAVVATQHARAFIVPLVAWAKRHEPVLFDSNDRIPIRTWWRSLCSGRGSSELLETFLHYFGHALTRPAHTIHHPSMQVVVGDVIRGGCDWNTVRHVVEILEMRVPDIDNNTSCHMFESDAIAGMNPTVLRCMEGSMIKDVSHMYPWQSVQHSGNWDELTVEALQWIVERYGYPFDQAEEADGPHALLNILRQALHCAHGNFTCYDWIERYIVSRSDGNESVRRNAYGLLLLEHIGGKGNDPNWHLPALWNMYGAQFATATFRHMQRVLACCAYGNDEEMYGRLAGALCAYWPHYTADIEAYARTHTTSGNTLHRTDCEQEELLFHIRTARAYCETTNKP